MKYIQLYTLLLFGQVWEREYKHDHDQHGIYLSSMLLNPQSRGFNSIYMIIYN